MITSYKKYTGCDTLLFAKMWVLLRYMLCLLLATGMTAASVRADPGISDMEARNMISFFQDYVTQESEYGTYPFFALYDVDEDGIPELISEPRKGDDYCSFVVYRYSTALEDFEKIAEVEAGFKLYRLPDGPGFSSYSMDLVPIYRWENGKLVNTEEFSYKLSNIGELKTKYCNSDLAINMSMEQNDLAAVKRNLNNMLREYEVFR